MGKSDLLEWSPRSKVGLGFGVREHDKDNDHYLTDILLWEPGSLNNCGPRAGS